MGCVLALVSLKPIAGSSAVKSVLNFSFKGEFGLIFFNLNYLRDSGHKVLVEKCDRTVLDLMAVCFFTCVRLKLGRTDDYIDSRR